MKKLLWLAAPAFLAAGSAHAATVLSDGFDAEGGATTILNYGTYTNFNVSDGTVDQIHTGGYGITCIGGTGGCVDLDGTTDNGATMTTKSAYAFNAGDVVTLSIWLSGNQRGGAADEFSFGFNITSGTTDFLGVTESGVFGPGTVVIGDIGTGLFLGSGRPNGTLGLVGADEPFTNYTISFTAGTSGTLTAFVATDSADDIGPILDNFELDIGAPGVPEPASWAMMIAGFALAGAALRSRKALLRFA